MRILDRYILKELMGPFFFGIAAFSSVFIGTSTLFRIAQYITQHGASVTSVTKIFFYSLPNIILLTFPMSMLLASLLSFGRLSSTSEITAMRSGGQSFLRLATPVFAAAMAVSLLAIIFNETVVPRANAAYQEVVQTEIMHHAMPRTQEHIVIKDMQGEDIQRLIYARNFNAKDGAMHGVTVQEYEKERLVRLENSAMALWQGDKWVMKDGVIYDLTKDGQVSRSLKFEEQILPTDQSPREISREQKKPEEMTMKELKQQIRALEAESIRSNLFQVELHQRLAIPMASFVFALVGAPLGLQPQRASSSIGLGLSVVIVFIYYGIMTISAALGQGGAIPAVWAAWIPNLVGMGVGMYLIRRASR